MEKNDVRDYSISSDNIKFPNFNNKDFEEKIREKVDENVLNKDIDTLIETINNLKKDYCNLISSNKNNFNTLTNSYKKRTYDFLVIIRAISSQFEILKLKINFFKNQNEKDLSLEKVEKISFDVFFEEEKEKFTNLISFQYKTDSDKTKLINIINIIISNSKDITNANSEYPINILDFCIKYSIMAINTIISQINTFSNLPNIKSQENQLIYFNLIFALEKLDSLSLFIRSCFLIPKNDIFNLDENSNEWNDIKKIICKVTPKNDKEIYDAFDYVEKYFNSLRPLVTWGITSSWNSINVIKCIPLLIKYKIYPNSSMYDSKKLQMMGCENLVSQVLNLGKIPLIKKYIFSNCPKIYRRKIYLKREEKEITLSYIKSLLQKINNQNKEINEELIKEEIETLNVNDNKPLYLEKISHEEKQYYTSTRLLHSSQIIFSNENNKYYRYFFCKTPKNKIRNTLFIHIHGGGFVSMTTTMHEPYLRKWSNKLNIPIIGLNYNLSPKVKYPKAIDDCFQSYMWLIKHAKNELNLDFKYIILSGDSAGGTLILSLLFLLLYKNKIEKLNIKLPDLILAQYPCCNTSINNMNLSLMLSWQDFFLNDDFLKYVCDAYRGNYNDDNDPFLNPEKVNLDILKFLPKIRFFFGQADPLRDDTIRLIYKISQIKNLDVKAYQFEFYGHGFYGLDPEILQKNPTEILISEVEEFLKEKNC